MELRVPVLIIIPTTLGYSFIEDAESMAESVGAGSGSEETQPRETDGPSATDSHPEGDVEASNESDDSDRDAIFIGLGDAVMPSILVASASVFLETPTVLGIELAALGAVIGTTVGLLVLLWMVLKGRAHAGLPLLNGGSIAGYLGGALLSGIPLLTALGLDAWV